MMRPCPTTLRLALPALFVMAGSAAFAQTQNDADALPLPPVYTAPGGQPGYYQPPMDPVQPAQPGYAQPGYAQPGYAQPIPPGYAQAQPRPLQARRARLGLGLRGHYGWAAADPTSYVQAGGNVDLLYRSSPRWTTEFSLGYQRTVRDESGLDRMFVPLTLGARLHLGRPSWAVSPYLVGAGGFTYGRLNLPELYEQAWFFELQAGGGFEIRAGRHVAFTFDARVVGRLRVDRAERLVLEDEFGEQWEPMTSQVGAQLGGGLGIYF